jgi:predicted nucleic acid-binding protein
LPPRRSFDGTVTPATGAVLDASAIVRGVLGEDDSAGAAWIEAVVAGRVRGLVPELAYAEVANALAVSVRGRDVRTDQAHGALNRVLGLPLDVVRINVLIREALRRALASRMSVYDACYLVAAEAFDAVLVTADRRLARAAPNSALLPKVGPPS